MQKKVQLNKTIIPAPLKGGIVIPPSKSMAHRAVLSAALACGQSVIHNIGLSEDVLATVRAVKQLGAKVLEKNGCLIIQGIQSAKENARIDCAESGTTLRLFIPVLAALMGGTLTGRGRLPQRPVDEYLKLFDQQGLVYHKDAAGLPLTVAGGLKSGAYALSGSVSSQYISGLLFALPLLAGDSEIVIEDTLESSGYVDMTLQVLHTFGIAITEKQTHKHYLIQGNQKYKACAYTVEGDWSQAAFFLLAGVMGEGIALRGLKHDTFQKDREFMNLLIRMGADIHAEGDSITVRKSALTGISADVSQMPDIAPALAGAMAIAQGASAITGGKRLRIKESDRIAATVDALRAIGAKLYAAEDGMTVEGVSRLQGGRASSHNDHRIVMTLAALSAACEENVIIEDAQAVNKSYPSFFEDFKSLGGIIE